MIKAKVNVITSKAEYKPGDIIGEKLSPADMAYLKKRKFITVEGEKVINADETPDSEDVFAGFGYDEDVQPENGIEYMDEAALQKLKKDELVEYAVKLGLELDESMLKGELINAILNHVEEHAAE